MFEHIAHLFEKIPTFGGREEGGGEGGRGGKGFCMTFLGKFIN